MSYFHRKGGVMVMGRTLHYGSLDLEYSSGRMVSSNVGYVLKKPGLKNKMFNF